MSRRALLLASRAIGAICALVALARPASAQEAHQDIAIQSFDPDQATLPISGVEGPGVKIGEGTVVHPVLGVETGVVSNVFYEAVDPKLAGVLRLLAQVGAGTLSTPRLAPVDETSDDKSARPGELVYRASLRLSYDLLMSDHRGVEDTGGLGVGGGIRGVIDPMGTWSFGFEEDFARIIRAANFETDVNTNRIINQLQLNALFRPPGRSLSAFLYYQNTIDVFERSEQRFANRFMHRLGLRPMWQWLPKTQVYVDASIGSISGLGDDAENAKVASTPLVAVAGISTLLVPRITVNLQAGYTNGFYETGPSFQSALVSAQVGYRYSPFGRAGVTYDLTYQDSINANYYRDHIVRAWVRQMFVPFVVMVQPELHFRKYDGITIVDGPPVRNDVIFAVVGGIHYNFRNSIAASLDYRFTTVQTGYRYMTDGIGDEPVIDDPSFTRHQLMIGARMAL